MNNSNFAKRIAVLERTVQELQSRIAGREVSQRWWVEAAGRFADDPVFDEILRLGKQYRKSLRPRSSRRKK